MTIVQEIKDALDGGDPVVREWFLIDGYFWPPALCVAYVLFVKVIGPAYMKNRKPYNLRNAMVAYNFALVITYVVCLLTVLHHALTNEVQQHICNKTVVDRNGPLYRIARIAHVIYLLKYVEFLDTIFFILRKKNHLVSGLHVVHHGSLPFVGWLLMRTEISGFQFFPGMLNSFVHVIMYSYYGLAAVGPSVRKYLWWKKYLTMLQMGQFVVIVVFVVVFIPLSGCQTSRFGTAMDILLAGLFLALFYNYYRNTYKPSAAKKTYANGVNGTTSMNGTAGINGKISVNGGVKCVEENGHASSEVKVKAA